MVRKQNKQEKRISSSTTAAIGAVIILIGGFFLSYNYIISKKIVAYDYMASVFNRDVEILDYEGELEKEPVEEELGEVTNDYIGYLTIPKINLKKGFLDM